MAQETNEIYTTNEAAKFLRISPITLWRERKKGKIAFCRVASRIVYLQRDLENYLNRNKREAFGAMQSPNALLATEIIRGEKKK